MEGLRHLDVFQALEVYERLSEIGKPCHIVDAGMFNGKRMLDVVPDPSKIERVYHDVPLSEFIAHEIKALVNSHHEFHSFIDTLELPDGALMKRLTTGRAERYIAIVNALHRLEKAHFFSHSVELLNHVQEGAKELKNRVLILNTRAMKSLEESKPHIDRLKGSRSPTSSTSADSKS